MVSECSRILSHWKTFKTRKEDSLYHFPTRPAMMDYGAVNVQDSSSYFKIYENLNITFLPQSFFLTCPLIKYNSSSQYLQLFLILWKWVQTVSWLDPEVSTAFGCSLDKKMDWSHDHCIVCLSAFYTILKLKSINCFICQFRNKWKPSRRQYLVKLKAGIGLPIIDHH